MRRTAFAAGLILVCAGTARAEGKLIAVLPLDVRMTEGKMSKAAEASLEEMLRDVATTVLSASGWTVLTGETMLQVLADNGVDAAKCGDQSCHLTMAREIKAEKFLSGAVQFVEKQYTASIRLIDTQSGRILASERLEAKSVTGLRKGFEAKAEAFFKRGGLLNAAPVAPVVPAAPAETRASLNARNELGPDFVVVRMEARWDSAVVFSRTDDTGALNENRDVAIYDGKVPPGHHVFFVQYEMRGTGENEGHRYNASSSYDINVPEGKQDAIQSILYERPGGSLEERPAVRFEHVTN